MKNHSDRQSQGGQRKTTLSVNIAGYLASLGQRVAILDLDRQKSASLWLATRPTIFLPCMQWVPEKDMTTAGW